MNLIEQISESITPESAKIVKRYAKEHNLKPVFSIRMPANQKSEFQYIFSIIYSHYCGDSFKDASEQNIPVDNIYASKNRDDIACTMDTIDKNIPISINTNPCDIKIFNCEENISALKEGYVFEVDGVHIGGYPTFDQNTNRESFRYFTFNQIKEN